MTVLNRLSTRMGEVGCRSGVPVSIEEGSAFIGPFCYGCVNGLCLLSFRSMIIREKMS